MKTNKKALKVTLVILLFILIAISTFFANYFYNMRDLDLNHEKTIVNTTNSLTYNVILKDEAYYKGEYNNVYVTNFIDEINSSFNYSAVFSNKVKGKYSYYITGRLETKEENSSQVLLNRNVYTSEVSEDSIEGNVINISSSFVIDLDDIKKVYDEFIQNYSLNLLGDVSFDVVISYKVFDEVTNKDIENSKILNIKIPINAETTTVNVTPKENNQRKEYANAQNEFKSVYFIISLEFFCASILFGFIIILIIRNMTRRISPFEKKVQHYLRKYNSLIVKIETLPDLSKSDCLFVKSFKDLVDASTNLDLPINYIEIKKNSEVVFIITNDNQAYVYKMKN